MGNRGREEEEREKERERELSLGGGGGGGGRGGLSWEQNGDIERKEGGGGFICCTKKIVPTQKTKTLILSRKQFLSSDFLYVLFLYIFYE